MWRRTRLRRIMTDVYKRQATKNTGKKLGEKASDKIKEFFEKNKKGHRRLVPVADDGLFRRKDVAP